MPKVFYVLLFLFLMPLSLIAGRFDVDVDSEKNEESHPLLKVTIMSPLGVTLTSSEGKDQERFLECCRHSNPLTLPEEKHRSEWFTTLLQRREQLNPYHLFKVVFKGSPMAFIAIEPLMVEKSSHNSKGLESNRNGVLENKWRTFGLIDEYSEPISGAGLARIHTIFPSDMDLDLQAEALRMSTRLILEVTPYFTFPQSTKTEIKLPKDWKLMLALTHLRVQKWMLDDMDEEKDPNYKRQTEKFECGKMRLKSLLPESKDKEKDLQNLLGGQVAMCEPKNQVTPKHIVAFLPTRHPSLSAFLESGFQLEYNSTYAQFLPLSESSTSCAMASISLVGK